MRYLVFGVWHDPASGQVFTYSKEYDTPHNPEDIQDEIVDDLCTSAQTDKDTLHEVFVFASAQNYGSAPVNVACWCAEGGDFEDLDEDEEEDP